MEANTTTVERLRKAYESGDLEQVGRTFVEMSHPDLIQEYPQSGERFRGADNIRRMNESYASATGTRPSMQLAGLRGGPDVWVAEGTIDYGDGSRVAWVSIAELSEGQVTRLTDYFAAPFEAPEWRREYRDSE
jgi:hypothetical protein